MAQTLMLDITLNIGENETVNVEALKKAAAEYAAKIKEDKDFEPARDELKKKALLEAKK